MRRPPSPRPAGILRPAYVSLVADSRYRPKKKFRSTQGTQPLPRRRDPSRPRLADLVSIAQRELRTTLAQRQSPKVRECGYRGLIERQQLQIAGEIRSHHDWLSAVKIAENRDNSARFKDDATRRADMKRNGQREIALYASAAARSAK